MHMAETLARSLQRADCHFDLVEHAHSATSLESARKAGVPVAQMAKPVILDDRRGHYLMAVLPANRQLDLGKVHKGPWRWQLTSEQSLGGLFRDCERGAVPALGEAYGMGMLIDPALARQSHIYLEAGDHELLVELPIEEFFKLAPNAQLCALSQ
ncbi:MAG TPA: YbaK/EbsC family protein [Pseudomonas sp.]|nr:YbaK/EbsC family protein [Pseudomonas sp.]